jgi:hypothetical protein
MRWPALFWRISSPKGAAPPLKMEKIAFHSPLLLAIHLYLYSYKSVTLRVPSGFYIARIVMH